MILSLLLADADAGKLSSALSDTDGDGVVDGLDMCPGTDDSVDLDGNGVADCSETLAAGAHFDDSGDLQYWTTGAVAGTSIGWTATDGGGYSASGSLGIGAVSNQSSGRSTHNDCIPVQPATPYNVLMQAKSQTLSSSQKTRVEVWQYSNADCSGYLGRSWVDTYGAFSWKTLGSRWLTGSSTHSIQVVVYVDHATDPTYTHWVWIDNLLVSPVSSKEYATTASER